jgi:hypothetical protein
MLTLDKLKIYSNKMKYYTSLVTGRAISRIHRLPVETLCIRKPGQTKQNYQQEYFHAHRFHADKRL